MNWKWGVTFWDCSTHDRRLKIWSTLYGDIELGFIPRIRNNESNQIQKSIKYIEPVYTNAQRNDFDWDLDNEPGKFNMDNRFDDVAHNHDVMYESFESRYATELVNVDDAKIAVSGSEVVVTLKGDSYETPLQHYIPGNAVLYVIVDGVRKAFAMQESPRSTADQPAGRACIWMGGTDIALDKDNKIYMKVANVEEANGVVTAKLQFKDGADGEYADATVSGTADAATVTTAGGSATVKFAAVARFDSEKDLTGKYLGEVEIKMHDYHFRPRPISLGVTWTQLTELVLDTSFGISTEEILLDYAAQEIKKSLDFQSIKYASDVQKTYASDNFVKFDAGYASMNPGTKDSYWHQAQLITQAIGHVEDNMLDKFGRGGVTAIVGGTEACRYLELNEGWSTKGAQPKIGAHKVGELNGTPVFKVPNGIIPKNQLITTWKNENAEGDVCIAIGTLVPFLATGALQRKNLYKEACIARYEDTQALRPEYLGRIQIDNIQ